MLLQNLYKDYAFISKQLHDDDYEELPSGFSNKKKNYSFGLRIARKVNSAFLKLIRYVHFRVISGPKEKREIYRCPKEFIKLVPLI